MSPGVFTLYFYIKSSFDGMATYLDFTEILSSPSIPTSGVEVPALEPLMWRSIGGPHALVMQEAWAWGLLPKLAAGERADMPPPAVPPKREYQLLTNSRHLWPKGIYNT